MSKLVGTVINALALIGASALVALIVRVFKGSKKSLKNASQSIVAAQLRDHIDNAAKGQHKAIEDALQADDAAAQLAKLGDDRREVQ